MGIARVITEALGLSRKAADVSAETLPGTPDATTGVQEVVDPIQKDLIDKKDSLEAQKADVTKKIEAIDRQMSATELTPEPQPQAPIKENASMADNKPAEEVKVETPAAPVAPAPVKEAAKTAAAEAPKAEEKKEEPKAEEKKEEPKKEAGFRIRFANGSTFDNSYFVAEENGKFQAVKASRIIPAAVQARIVKALAETGKAPEDVASVSDIIDQMTAQGVNSIETFNTAVTELSAQASLKPRTAAAADGPLMAWNASEVRPGAKPGEDPLIAMQKSEAEAGRKAIGVPPGSASPVRQYYSQLPGSSAVGAEPVKALNPQSMRDKIDFMRKALEEMKELKNAADAKAESFKNKADVLEKEKDDSKHNEMLESIVKDLVGKKLMDSKDEQSAISALAKIDKKSLPQVASLLKLLGKVEKSEMPKPAPFGGEEKKPAMVEEKITKSSSVVLPQFLDENDADTVRGEDFLQKYW